MSSWKELTIWLADPGWQILAIAAGTLALAFICLRLLDLFAARLSWFKASREKDAEDEEPIQEASPWKGLWLAIRLVVVLFILSAGATWILWLYDYNILPYSQPLLSWLSTKGLHILGTIFGACLVIWLVHGLVDRVDTWFLPKKTLAEPEQRRRLQTFKSILHNLSTIVVGLAAAIMVLRELGFDVTPLLTAAGVGGLAIGLGAQNLIKDYLGGFFLLAEDQLRVGDVVTINEVGGEVEQINLRTVVLRSLDGTVHTIPNGQITMVSNMTKAFSRSVIDVVVAYKENVDYVIEVLRHVGEELGNDPEYSPMLLEPIQVMGVNSLGVSGVTITVMATTPPLMQWEMGRALRRRIKNRFDELGIEIPFPQTTIHWAASGEPLRLVVEGSSPEGVVAGKDNQQSSQGEVEKSTF